MKRCSPPACAASTTPTRCSPLRAISHSPPEWPSPRSRGSKNARAPAFVVIAAIAAAPFVAALTPLAIIRPLLGEPDLLNDSITSPFSEWIGPPPIDVPATGIDAPLIARFKQAAALSPRADDDLVPD